MARGRLEPPNLDDRRWQDLVEQVQALIPTYAPEWTDRNPSDLGITLIELFAWLTEGLIYRLNRVPDKNLIAFLNLIGVTRDPATPATTTLTYRLANGMAPLVLPKGSQAATPQTESEQAIVFETEREITLLPVNLTTALYLAKEGDNWQYQNITANLCSAPLTGWSVTLAAGQEGIIALGFDQATTETLSLFMHFSQPRQVAQRPPLVPAGDNQTVTKPPSPITWRYSKDKASPDMWEPLATTMVKDGTNGLQKNGAVALTLPHDWTPHLPDAWPATPALGAPPPPEKALFWIGLHITAPAEGVPADAGAASKPATGATKQKPQPLTLGLAHILGNSVPATNALSIADPEFLGVSTGQPFQVFALQYQPLLKQPAALDPYGHLQIQVRTPKVGDGFDAWRDWTRADDLPAGDKPCFRLNPVTGEIMFGNYDPKITPAGHGAIPPTGSEVQAVRYRYVAGDARGNVADGRINVIRVNRTPLPGLVAVTNPGAATGGSDEEAVAETKRRGPESLRNRNRAITVEDYEFLAQEATTDVKKVRCLPPRLHTTAEAAAKEDTPWNYAGLTRAVNHVNVMIIPEAKPENARPRPTPELLQEVKAYLEQRRVLTAFLTVTGPRYLPIKVHLEMSIWQRAIEQGLVTSTTEMQTTLTAQVNRFLHPTLGGPAGEGWEIGQDLTLSGLFQSLQPSSAIGFITQLTLEAPNSTPDGERPQALQSDTPERVWIQVADYEIICSDTHHEIVVQAI